MEETKTEETKYNTIEEYFLDAIRHSDTDEVAYCLENNVDLFFTDENGSTALRIKKTLKNRPMCC